MAGFQRKYLFWLLAGLLAGLLPLLDPHTGMGELTRNVSKYGQLSVLETPYAYLYLHVFTFIPVFALSFDSRVHYYRSWKALFPAVLLVGVIFIVWDVYFTYKGVWGFNEQYLSGYFLFKLPVEEWLFFFTVPFACVFIYECLNYYLPWNPFLNRERLITTGLMLFSFLVAIVFHKNIYTATTFALCGWLLSLHLYAWDAKRASLIRSRFYMAYLVSCIPFVIVNGALTGSFTKSPIVMYNDTENLGSRLGSIPLDDFGYSFLLLFGVTTLYELFKKK